MFQIPIGKPGITCIETETKLRYSSCIIKIILL